VERRNKMGAATGREWRKKRARQANGRPDQRHRGVEGARPFAAKDKPFGAQGKPFETQASKQRPLQRARAPVGGEDQNVKPSCK
jgi:hypothetical protein